MGHLTAEQADRIAELVLANVDRVYPHKSGLVVRSAAELRAPSSWHPIFKGCFDWHSAVHSHWTLARLLRLYPRRPWHRRAEGRFDDSFTADAIAGERRTLEANPGFELPYGLVWLLTLAAELDHDFHSEPWGRALRPLEALSAERLESWMRRLSHPIRSGQHSQSAFAMTMLVRWADARGARRLKKLVRRRAIQLYEGDVSAPIDYEPSAHDFLSPTLAVAELMATVLPERDYARWLDGYLPRAATDRLQPVFPVDRSDGKLAHFDGLNLSRAWMLRSIASALAADDPRRVELESCADAHGQRGLVALDSDEYAVTHWVPTFALYWLSGP
ncbi:MAG: DUF2891 domain-containing protein [Deltaproteobacteria bacterium]|nr:DUF2891 domain-containing protein [Deltaproteobacteria bacterium]